MSTNFETCKKDLCSNVKENVAFSSTLKLVHLVGEAVPKLNFGSMGGWLEGESRRSSLRKFARARHTVWKQVAPRFKNGPLLKRQIFKIQARVNQWLIFARLNMRLFVCSMHPKAPVLQSDLKQPLLPK
jgi:hypothetical protein